jgi:hypothetical protein
VTRLSESAARSASAIGDSRVIPAKAGIHSQSAGAIGYSRVIPAKAGIQSFTYDTGFPHTRE